MFSCHTEGMLYPYPHTGNHLNFTVQCTCWSSFLNYELLLEKQTQFVNLINSETAVKMNYKYTWNNFYTFVFKIKDLLEAANSKKRTFLN
jgi:hypothetical protein